MKIPHIGTQQPDATNEIPTDLIDTKEAAKIAKMTTGGVWRWVLKGKIAGWRREGRLFVSRAAVLGMFKKVDAPNHEELKRLKKEQRDAERARIHEIMRRV